MAAGVSDKVWEIADIVRLVEEWEYAEQEQKAERRINSLSRTGSALGAEVMAIDIAGQKLLERFAAGGFTELINDEPMRLSEFLRARAKEDGMEAPVNLGRCG